MKKTLEIAIFIVIAAIVLSACPKKPKKPEIVPPVKKTEVEDTLPEYEPSLRGAEFQSIQELKTVYFDYDKYSITQESRKTLELDAEYLKKNTNLQVLIQGHTCECGTNEYNLGLGQKRASTVRDYLIQLGVEGKKIATISYGEEMCVNSNAGPPDTPQCGDNRRAEIMVRKTPAAETPAPDIKP